MWLVLKLFSTAGPTIPIAFLCGAYGVPIFIFMPLIFVISLAIFITYDYVHQGSRPL
jgi:hypothetical protein